MQLFNALKKVASVNVIRHLSQLIYGIIVAQYLGASEKGIIFLFTTVAATVAVLASFGFTNSLVFYCKKNRLSFERAVLYVFCLLALVSVFLVSVLMLFDLEILNFLFDGVGAGSGILVVFFIYCNSTLLGYFLNSYCLAFRYTLIYFFSFAVSSVTATTISFIGILYWGFTLLDTLFIFVATELIFFMLTLLWLKVSSNSQNIIIRQASTSEVVGYGLKSYLGVSGSTISANGDSFILAAYLSSEQIGIYSVAKTFYRLLVIVPQTVNGVLFGMFCDLTEVRARLLVKKLFGLYVVFTCLGMSLLAYLLDDVILFMFGDAFESAYFPTMILSISACMMTISSSINPFFLAFNMPMASSIITLISSFISLSSSFYLIENFGVIGAALSMSLGVISIFIMRLYFYNRPPRFL